MRNAALALLAVLSCSGQVADQFYFQEGKVRVLILTGRNNHDWRTTTPYLRQMLGAADRFDVRVTEEPAGLTDEVLAPYDVLISNYCGPRWGARAEAAVEHFVKSGKGLVVVHAADYPFGDAEVLAENMGHTKVYEKPWAEWGAMVGATWSEKPPKTGHAQRHVFEVVWQDPQHPIAAGMKPSFLIGDELYFNFRLKPGIHILATGFNSSAIGGSGKSEPLLWTNAYGKGRVFHTALGHDVDAMQSPGFVASLTRGTEWAATGNVTLPPVIDTNQKNKNAVRVLLVTGGHDHETSFYGAFEGWRDVRVNVDPHPAAFRKDLRPDYDVIALYDSVQTLGEEQQKNLRAFVESGKGVLILHHAIVDFGKWEWWWKQVVGGRYVLEAEPGYPASTYLHDVELVATPSPDHPITRGMPPMRLFDETYKNMWRAAGIQVILTTNEKTSDKEIGWVSPYSKSRVVYIQLGHARETHESPWYRQLVHRATLWSAGREVK
jgi:type 1 glutamine amidotransferase